MKQVSKRTCIGCLNKRARNKLVRLVAKKGKVVADLTDRTHGRGAYLCKKGRGINQSCLKLAIEKNAFKKSFKGKINQAPNRGSLGAY